MKRTCLKCPARLSKDNKSGLCKDHWRLIEPTAMLEILTDAAKRGDWCPTNTAMRATFGCSDNTIRSMLAKLVEAGLIRVEHKSGTRVVTVIGVGSTRAPELSSHHPTRIDNEDGPPPQRVERHVCPLTGMRIEAPISLATQGFTAWGARL